MGALTTPYEVIPGRKLTTEEVCSTVNSVKKSETVRQKIQEAVKRSQETNHEHGGWIVEDTPGEYSIPEIYEGEERMLIIPKAPPNAIGHFHTHPYAGIAYPSDIDVEMAATSKNKMIFYLTLGGDGHEAYINDEGEFVFCPNDTYFVNRPF